MSEQNRNKQGGRQRQQERGPANQQDQPSLHDQGQPNRGAPPRQQGQVDIRYQGSRDENRQR